MSEFITPEHKIIALILEASGNRLMLIKYSVLVTYLMLPLLCGS